MKLKDIIPTEEDLKPKIHRNYDDFIEDSDIPENSIELDENGRIVSDQLSLLKFVEFLLQQYEYCPENNNTEEFEDKVEKPKKKKKKHNKSYNELTLKQKKKRIKNMNHFLNGPSEYPV